MEELQKSKGFFHWKLYRSIHNLFQDLETNLGNKFDVIIDYPIHEIEGNEKFWKVNKLPYYGFAYVQNECYIDVYINYQYPLLDGDFDLQKIQDTQDKIKDSMEKIFQDLKYLEKYHTQIYAESYSSKYESYASQNFGISFAHNEGYLQNYRSALIIQSAWRDHLLRKEKYHLVTHAYSPDISNNIYSFIKWIFLS